MPRHDGKLEGEMPGADAVHITEGLPFTIGSRNVDTPTAKAVGFLLPSLAPLNEDLLGLHKRFDSPRVPRRRVLS